MLTQILFTLRRWYEVQTLVIEQPYSLLPHGHNKAKQQATETEEGERKERTKRREEQHGH